MLLSLLATCEPAVAYQPKSCDFLFQAAKYAKREVVIIGTVREKLNSTDWVSGLCGEREVELPVVWTKGAIKSLPIQPDPESPAGKKKVIMPTPNGDKAFPASEVIWAIGRLQGTIMWGRPNGKDGYYLEAREFSAVPQGLM